MSTLLWAIQEWIEPKSSYRLIFKMKLIKQIIIQSIFKISMSFIELYQIIFEKLNEMIKFNKFKDKRNY